VLVRFQLPGPILNDIKIGGRQMTESDLTLINYTKEPLFLKHADLERASDNSEYRSNCPVCKIGMLLVMRDQSTLEIIQKDYCVLCGQHVIYTDLGEQDIVEPPKKQPVRKLDF
jgi:hypothetical protein